eukprot:EC786714.1.p2 GENE.EC786714.1~~EC786714.1.p2  ORF type:complete len:73 (-),score=5.46 EC786714.1:243-461(-)
MSKMSMVRRKLRNLTALNQSHRHAAHVAESAAHSHRRTHLSDSSPGSHEESGGAERADVPEGLHYGELAQLD